MTKVLKVMVALATMGILLGNASVGHAALIFQDVNIDLANGSLLTFVDNSGNTGKDWRITTSIPQIVMAQGDSYVARVRFLNQKALEIASPLGLYNGGIEISKLRLFFQDPTSNNNWVATGAYDFVGVFGQVIADPLSYSVSGSGYAFSTGPQEANLTDSSFSFSGVDISVNFLQYVLNFGDGIFNQLNLTFAAESIAIVDIPPQRENPAPEPGTIALVAAALLGASVTRRRKPATATC